MDAKELIARRVALELRDRTLVNLGIGLPTLVARYVPRGITVAFQSENGIIGFGAPPPDGMEDPHLTDAGGGFISALPGAVSFDSGMSFALAIIPRLTDALRHAIFLSEKEEMRHDPPEATETRPSTDRNAIRQAVSDAGRLHPISGRPPLAGRRRLPALRQPEGLRARFRPSLAMRTMHSGRISLLALDRYNLREHE